MYLSSLILIILLKINKFKKANLTIKLTFLNLFLIWLIFFKKTHINLINTNSYNNFFWDNVLILNSNNKSISYFLLILLFNIILSGKINNIKKMHNLVYFVIILINYSIFLLNEKTSIVFKNNLNININLINGLIIIHPLYIYLTYIAIIIFFIFSVKKNKNFLKKTQIIRKSLFYSFFAIFLGSYWSQQEMNWGGWWNWDFVEIVALIFFIKSSLLNHITFKKNLNFLISNLLRLINYLLLFFFLIRLDFINSIHSFNVFGKTSLNLNLVCFLYIIFIIIIVVKNNNNYNKYYNNNIKNNSVVTLLFLILLFIFNIYIYINIFYSYFFNTQYIELTKYLKSFLNSILFIYLSYIIKNIKLLLIAASAAINNNLIFLIILIYIIIIKIINNYKYNYKNIFHIFIIIFIIINNFYYNYIYYSLNLHSIESNVSLMNNINTLNNVKHYLMYLYYYNNNNYSVILNSYYCYNNNILFNNVFNETLLNNILLYNNNINIEYKIENYTINNILFKFNWILIIIYLIILSNYIFFNIKLKKNNLKIV